MQIVWVPSSADNGLETRIGGRQTLQTNGLLESETVVAVVLGIGDNQAITVDPQDGRVVLGSDIDTTECLQYTPLDYVSGTSSGPKNAQSILVTQNYTGPQSTRRLQQNVTDQNAAGKTPVSDLLFALRAAVNPGNVIDVENACSDQTTVVLTTADTVRILIKVSSLVSVLPQDAISISNGRMLPIEQDLSCGTPPCPYVEDAWNVFPIIVELGPPNTVTNISVAHNALKPALVNGANLTTAPSNVILASRDVTPPQVILL